MIEIGKYMLENMERIFFWLALMAMGACLAFDREVAASAFCFVAVMAFLTVVLGSKEIRK